MNGKLFGSAEIRSVRFGPSAPAIAAINEAVNAVLARPAVRDILTQSGVEPQGGTAEAMGKLLAADTVRWAEVIEKAGIPRQ